jgi:hypothetical protein
MPSSSQLTQKRSCWHLKNTYFEGGKKFISPQICDQKVTKFCSEFVFFFIGEKSGPLVFGLGED